MEESISKAAGATFGEFVSPAEFRAKIRSIDRIPAERTTTYEIRRIFNTPQSDLAEAPPHLPVIGNESRGTYVKGAY
jgi:FO synthase subunit 2